MAKTSNSMLNESGESGYLCLFPELTGHYFSFSLLRIMSVVNLSYVAFVMLIDSLCAKFLENF